MSASIRTRHTYLRLAAAFLLISMTHAVAYQEVAPPPPRPQQPILYGIQFEQSRDGQVVVTTVYPDSPAAKAGLRPGDIIEGVANRPIANGRELTRVLTGRQPGERIAVQVMRSGRPTTMELIADASVPVLADSPAALTADQRAFGWTLQPSNKRVVLAEVADGSAASRLGLRAADVILAVDGVEVASPQEFNDLMSKLMAQRPGETIPVTILRGEDKSVVSLSLPTTPAATPPKPVATPVVADDRDDSGRAFGMVVKSTAGGLVVTDIAPGSPAERAGLAPGDTVLKIGSANVDTYTGLLRAFDLFKPAPEVKIAFARDGQPMETTLVIGPPRGAVVDADLERLRSEATHIVVGGVKAIYSFEQTTPDWQISHRIAEVAVAEVEKGEGIEPGQLLYVRYSVQGNPATASAEKTPYPNVRSTFRLFTKRAADGGYDLLLPGGAQIVDGPKVVAAATARPAPVVPAVPAEPAPAPAVAVVPAEPVPAGPVPAGRGIDGTVVLAEVPQPGIQVDLWDAAGLVATTTTNSKGNFAFNVPPGRYMVSARGTVGTLIRVTPPITVFVPNTATARTPLKIPLR